MKTSLSPLRKFSRFFDPALVVDKNPKKIIKIFEKLKKM